MRWLIALVALAAMATPAVAAKRVTVAQFEEELTAASAAHKPAVEMARLIAGTELSERLSEDRAERLNAKLNAGAEVALALALLADRSAFLNLPASELPAMAAPDQATQLKMFDAAGVYVAQTLSRLPNFLATRTTIHYDDSPQEVKKGAWPQRAGLHVVGRWSREISVFGEKENSGGGKDGDAWQEASGLTSWGEFGSALGMILSDSVNGGKVGWSHWENMPAGVAAVFQYSVPKPASHFEVVSSFQRQAGVEGFAEREGGSRIAGIGARPNANPGRTTTQRTKRAYRGSLWLDPATGTILRITIEADSPESSAFQRAAMLVQYGAVEIGGKTFICPVRSLAHSHTLLSADASINGTASEWLNETLFTGYHRFAATTRILTDADAATPPDGQAKPK
jgi:hypothetical protein